MAEDVSLTEFLDDLVEEGEDGSLEFGSLIERFETRGFGPVLMVPALVCLLPTGGIPTVPTICGATIVLLSLQQVFGKRHPWVPRRIRELEMPSKGVKAWADWARPKVAKLDRIFGPRWTQLSKPPVDRAIALVSALVGFSMIPLEIIPWASSVPALAILLAALGLATRDGALILLSLFVDLGSFYLLATQISQVTS